MLRLSLYDANELGFCLSLYGNPIGSINVKSTGGPTVCTFVRVLSHC